jgi:predicted GIY-YIG superfamily endonuclease
MVLSERSESKDGAFHVYLLLLENNSIYVGSTDNVSRRFQEHLSGKGSATTKKFRPIKVIFTEAFPNRTTAVKRELQIKRWSRAKKWALATSSIGQLKTLARSHSSPQLIRQ